MKKILLFTVTSVILSIYSIGSTSCSREDYGKQIKQLDSLKTQLNTYSLQLNSIDSNAIMDLKPIIAKDINWIKDSLTKETMSLGSVFLVTVRAGSKLTESFPAEYPSLKAEVSYSITQIDDLLEDLNKGKIEIVKANKYVKDELMAFRVIEGHVNKMLGRLESLKDYTDIRNDFYDRLKQQGVLSE